MFNFLVTNSDYGTNAYLNADSLDGVSYHISFFPSTSTVRGLSLHYIIHCDSDLIRSEVVRFFLDRPVSLACICESS